MENSEKVFESLNSIKQKDPEFYNTIVDTVNYLASTYEDKYAASPIKTKGIILSQELGKGYNIGNCTKYLQRYLTTGFAKSENTEDLRKVIHYSMFEITRKNSLKK